MPDDTESRFCPYCGIELNHPYWKHVQKEHSERYAQKETWVQLYKDYKGAGMDESISIQVISELFNSTIDEIKSFLKNAKAL